VQEPRLVHVETLAELEGLRARARAEGRPLYVLYGHRGQNTKRRPEVLAVLEDRAQFEPLGRFEAVAPEFVYRVVRDVEAGGGR